MLQHAISRIISISLMEMTIARILHCVHVLLESANEGHPTSDENRIMQLGLIHLPPVTCARANYTNGPWTPIYSPRSLPFLFKHKTLYLAKGDR